MSESINRANSQHSTGPKTESGKQRSSMNALRHGLTSQIVVMPGEDQDAYELHLQSFLDEYHPQGATETHLVQSLADTSWRLNRIGALEAHVIKSASISVERDIDTKALANLSLHSQRLARQFERTVTQLRDLQTTRLQLLNTVVDLIEIHQSKGESYDPSAHGFVFSDAQIQHAMHLRTIQLQRDSAKKPAA